jgi:hypothetical protein
MKMNFIPKLSIFQELISRFHCAMQQMLELDGQGSGQMTEAAATSKTNIGIQSRRLFQLHHKQARAPLN